MQESISDIITDAKISLYLASVDVQKSTLFPRPVNRQSPEVIYTELKSVEWAYSQNPNYQNIRETANYLYWLTGQYNLRAKYIRNGGGGGIPVKPINPTPTYPLRIVFIVSNSSFIPSGGNTLSIPQFIGYDILFNRNGTMQSPIDNGSTYYTWDKVNGIFVCIGAASAGETFDISPNI